MAESDPADAAPPEPFRAVLAAAADLQRRDRPREAETLLRKALCVTRGALPVFMGLIRLLERTGQLKAAACAYREYVEAHPRDACASFSAGVFFYNKLRRPREALAHLRQFAAAEPSSPEWRFNRLLALMNLRRHAEAFADGERLLDMDLRGVDVAALFHPWLAVHDKVVFREHLRALDRGASSIAGGRWRWFYSGCLARRISGPAESLRFFRAMSTLPASRYGWMSYGSACARMDWKDYRGAIQDLRRALDSRVNLWMARCKLGEAHLLLGHRKRGWDQFDLAAEEADLASVKGNVLAWRGQMHLRLGHFSESVSALDGAIGLGARFAYGWRGGALLALGRLDESLSDLETAVRLIPQDGEARAWLTKARSLRLNRRAAVSRAAGQGPGRSGAVPRRRRA